MYCVVSAHSGALCAVSSCLRLWGMRMILGSGLAEGWQSFSVADAQNGEERNKQPSGGWQSLKTALLASATSVVAYPVAAQQAPEPVPLPPLSVEATKKKAPAKKAAAKKAPAAQQVSPAVQPPAQPMAQKSDPLPGEAGPPAPGSFNAGYSSSPKMTGPLLDTPQTVNVITNAVIQERNSSNLTEALRNVPGISFNAGENGFTSSINNFSIRGFDTSGNVFIDGVRDSGSYARDTFNVDRVEVVKGAAADNGRGGAGGYVNIVTKTPTNEDFLRADMVVSFDEYGTDPLVRSTIDFNKRSGTVAVRMNGMVEDGGVMGRDVAEYNAYGLAPSITFGMGTDTRVTFAYERLQRQDIPDWGVSAHSLKGMMRYDSIAARADRDNFYGLYTDFDDVESDSVVARVEHDLSDNFTISNQTRWSQTDRQARFTFPNGFTASGNGGSVATVHQFYDRENTSISNLTNLSGRFMTGSLRHTISTGVEYTHEESDANRQAQRSSSSNPPFPGTDIFNPDPGRTPGFPFAPTQKSGVTIDTIAAYAYDTIELNRHWEVVGGVRVENYNVELSNKTIAGASLAPIDGYEDSETSLSGKIGIVYKPVRDGSFYVSYGTSVLPPGSLLSNPDISREGNDGFPGLVLGADPVRMHNYEAGVKWDFFNGRFSTTAAVFRTEKHDVVTNGCDVLVTTNNPCSAANGRTAYGTQIVQGIELGVAGALTEHWKVFGGVAILDSERQHSREYDRIRRNANSGDYPTGVTSTDGDELAFTPNVTATLWTTYDVTKDFTIGGGFQYVSDSWLGRPDDAIRVIPNGAFGKLPSYFVTNFMASYDLTENVELRLNIDNVFNEEYALSTNWPGQRVLLGPPRTFRIGTSVDF